MRLHIVALPHVKLGTDQTCLCAYSAKVEKFIRMMGDRHELIVYGVEGPDLPGATLVPCLSGARRIETFGPDDPNRLPEWPNDAQSRLFNLSAAVKLLERAKPKELILLVGGRTHMPITEFLTEFTFCEPFVGYEGIFTNKCAFESYAWMTNLYQKWGFNDIRWFDAVVPPFCDPDEFPNLNSGKGEYLAFLGRAINRKGPQIALEIAKAVGLPLRVAGAGWKQEAGALVGMDVRLEGDESQLQYVGPVNVEQRAEFLAGARALLVCTTYLEPGGNVAIEAMLSGTPVVCPDFGVYAETVRHGVSGFHFRLLREAVAAVRRCDELYPANIRQYSYANYSLEAIGPKFDHWLDNLTTLFEDGWYQGHKPKVEEKKMEATDWLAEDHPFYEDPSNPHLGGFRIGGDEATTYPDLWTWLVNDHKVESVIDVGCGDGVAVRFFETLLPGSVIGVDGVPQPAGNIYQHDLTDDEWMPPVRGSQLLPEYDLVWCVEFVEHVEERFIPNFLETFKCSRTVLLTHAMPGQQGHHHVNLRTPAYWIGCMAGIGYRLDEELTKKTRELAGLNKSPHNHFTRSGLAFMRN